MVNNRALRAARRVASQAAETKRRCRRVQFRQGDLVRIRPKSNADSPVRFRLVVKLQEDLPDSPELWDATMHGQPASVLVFRSGVVVGQWDLAPESAGGIRKVTTTADRCEILERGGRAA